MMIEEDDLLRYDIWIEEALRGVIRRSLLAIEASGLPGDHHFYITFRTDHPDVHIADWLCAEYPEEMTIVLQHQYEDLSIGPEGFNVRLRFAGRPELLEVPYEAITSFADPSVSFGLQLKSVDLDEEDEDMDGELTPEELGINPSARLNDSARTRDGDDDGDGDGDDKKTGEVITLDAFRKK